MLDHPTAPPVVTRLSRDTPVRKGPGSHCTHREVSICWVQSPLADLKCTDRALLSLALGTPNPSVGNSLVYSHAAFLLQNSRMLLR